MQSKQILIMLKYISLFFLFMAFLANIIFICVSYNKTSSIFTLIFMIFSLLFFIISYLYKKKYFISNSDADDMFSNLYLIGEYKNSLKMLRDKNNYILEHNNRLDDLRKHYEKNMKEVKKIQEDLIVKKLPNSEKIYTESIYKPIDLVGGDYYDCMVDADNILFLISDISGHGFQASILTGMLKTSFNTFASYNKKTSDILEDINKQLINILPKNYFLTANLVNINLSSKTLRYSNASHTSFFIKRGDNILEFSKSGTIIGLFPNASYEEETVNIESGDIIVFYTDGIIEASRSKNKYDFYGKERLKKSLIIKNKKDEYEDNLSKIMKSIESSFYGYLSFRTPDDDFTVVLFKVV